MHVEICEDLWVPVPPSSLAALAGATILTNLSASNITIGKSQYRHMLCASQSGRCLAAYAYAAAGSGESTTDLAWDGHGMVYENGQLLAETERFAATEQLIVSDIDLERLVQERARITSFNDAVGDMRVRTPTPRRIPVPFEVPDSAVALVRQIERDPYVPSDPVARGKRCREAYNIQVQGLATRLASTTSRSRTCRPASAHRTSSASPISRADLWWARAISANWRSGGARMASATRCRISRSPTE